MTNAWHLPNPYTHANSDTEFGRRVLTLADSSVHRPQLTEEVLVPPSPNGVRDPLSDPMSMRSLVTMPTRHGHCLPHRHGDSPADGVEAEQHALQVKGFYGAAIATILAPTRDSSHKVYHG